MDNSRSVDAESSFDLLQRAREGDASALDALLRRHMPRLQRWARGRLPQALRDGADTDDLVQDTVLRTLKQIEGFEPRREGALQAYLRTGVMNAIRDACRVAARRPARQPLPEDVRALGPSPLDEVVGREAVERYELALSELVASDREAIIARIELGCSYEEIAEALDKPSPEAARVAVARALVRLAKGMGRAV